MCAVFERVVGGAVGEGGVVFVDEVFGEADAPDRPDACEASLFIGLEVGEGAGGCAIGQAGDVFDEVCGEDVAAFRALSGGVSFEVVVAFGASDAGSLTACGGGDECDAGDDERVGDGEDVEDDAVAFEVVEEEEAGVLR